MIPLSLGSMGGCPYGFLGSNPIGSIVIGVFGVDLLGTMALPLIIGKVLSDLGDCPLSSLRTLGVDRLKPIILLLLSVQSKEPPTEMSL
jgi:hypothetical protein